MNIGSIATGICVAAINMDPAATLTTACTVPTLPTNKIATDIIIAIIITDTA